MNKDSELIKKQLEAAFTKITPDGNKVPAHRWRVQAHQNGVSRCIAYVDSRQVSERLNEVLGIDGWSSTLIEMTGTGIICELSVNIAGKEVTKSDVGTPSKEHAEKGRASDAFKRSAVLLGVGKYLYQIDPVELKTTISGGKKYPTAKDGTILKTPAQLTSYINGMGVNGSKLIEVYESLSEEQKTALKTNFTAIWKTLKA